MKRLFNLLFIISFCWVSFSSFAEEDHKDSKGKSSATSRPSEGAKKPVSLSEKLSACLTERPGSSKPSSNKSDSESTGALPTGEALFSKYCASCHSAGGSKGPISDWKLAAQRAGTDMPPSGESIPEEELSLLQDYLRSR